MAGLNAGMLPTFGFAQAQNDSRVRLEAEAAVDGEELAGDEVGGGGEEGDGGGDVRGGSVAAHGGFFGEVLVGGVDLALHDHAGGDAVDADLGGPGLGHGLREHVKGGLGGAVVAVGGPGVDAAERADVDDAAVDAAEVREGGLGDEEGCAGVGGEHVVPLPDGEVFEGLGLEEAGVVDEDVNAVVEVFGDGGDGFGGGERVGEVAAGGKGLDVEVGEIADGLLGFGLRFEIGDGDVGATFGEGDGDGAADAFCGSGDERGLALEGFVHPATDGGCWWKGRWCWTEEAVWAWGVLRAASECRA